MEFLSEYGMFVAKLATVVVFFLLALAGMIVLFKSGRAEAHERLELEYLNDKYADMRQSLEESMGDKSETKKLAKERKARKKAHKKSQARRRIFVLEFDGDIRASQVAQLRQEITAVMTVVRPEDEVFLKLYSLGGQVHGYGLAASQLTRLREREIPFTVAVDKVAASGGYMMACVANRILSAPFAIVGSIGVVAQLPNFHRLLKKHDVDFEQITAGEHKRTLTMFGENTPKARAKFQQEIEDTHELFKQFINQYRPAVNLETAATGEHWFGRRALDLNLVDEIKTSDDFLLEAIDEFDLYRLKYKEKKPLGARFGGFLQSLWLKTEDSVWSRQRNQHLP